MRTIGYLVNDDSQWSCTIPVQYNSCSGNDVSFLKKGELIRTDINSILMCHSFWYSSANKIQCYNCIPSKHLSQTLLKSWIIRWYINDRENRVCLQNRNTIKSMITSVRIMVPNTRYIWEVSYCYWKSLNIISRIWFLDYVIWDMLFFVRVFFRVFFRHTLPGGDMKQQPQNLHFRYWELNEYLFYNILCRISPRYSTNKCLYDHVI